MKKTLIFALITLLDILLIFNGYKNNNRFFKVIGFIFLIPIIYAIVSLIYAIFFT